MRSAIPAVLLVALTAAACGGPGPELRMLTDTLGVSMSHVPCIEPRSVGRCRCA